jgi:hypothetical protein
LAGSPSGLDSPGGGHWFISLSRGGRAREGESRMRKEEGKLLPVQLVAERCASNLR